jgi:PAS domain S-box-containing protein
MAGKFWFRKRDDRGRGKESGFDDRHSETGAVAITDDVFPVSLTDEEEESATNAGQVIEQIKREAQVTKVKADRLKGEKGTRISYSEASTAGVKPAEGQGKSEHDMSIMANKNANVSKSTTFSGATGNIIPMGKPVMTPVRMAPKTAPVKLKSVSESKKNTAVGVDQTVTDNRQVTPALKVVNKERSSGPLVDSRPRFSINLGKPDSSDAAAPGKFGSEAVKIEKPQNDQRKLYYQLMNGLYDAVLILDDHGHVVDCNERVLKLLGYTREDSWDMPIDQVIKGMNSQMFEHLKRNLAENHNVLITARCFRSDGGSFKGEIGVSTLSLTSESNVVFAIRNVDQRKSTMDELRRAAAAFDVALVPAFVCNLEGFFTNVNRNLLKSFGISDVAEALKLRFVDLLPDAARFFAKALSGESIREKLDVTDAQGHVIKLELALEAVKNGNEVVAGSILPI